MQRAVVAGPGEVPEAAMLAGQGCMAGQVAWWWAAGLQPQALLVECPPAQPQ